MSAMFQIGQTSGACKSADQGHEVVAGFEDYVDKLAKKACDIPKKTLAPTKIAQITDGCFSTASTIETGIECACSGDVTNDSSEGDSESDSAAEAAAEAAADAQSDANSESSDSQSNDSRGSCGGRSSTTSKTDSEVKQKQAKTESKEEKTCCGGGTSQDKKTGTKLTTFEQPSDVQDVVQSTYQEMIDQRNMSETEFRSTYCDTQPYPECASCEFARTLNETTDYNIHSLVQSVEDGLVALAQGQIDVADRIFSCPGMLAAMFEAELGPFGKIVGKTAANAIIGMTALHGAVKSFTNCYGAAWNTDLRREVMSCCGGIIRAGSSVPPQFVDQANAILRDMGCEGDTLIKLKTSDRTPWSSRPEDNFSLFSSAAIGYSVSDAVREKVYLSDQRQEASEESKAKAKTTLASIKGSLDTAREVVENPYAALVQDQLVSAVETDCHQKTTDTIAQPNVTYFKKNSETGKFEVVDIPTGEDLSIYRAKTDDNELYVIVVNGMISKNPDSYQTTEDTVAKLGVNYYKLNLETGLYEKIDVETGDDLSPYREAADDNELYVVVNSGAFSPDLILNEDEVAVANRIYYFKDDTTGAYVELGCIVALVSLDTYRAVYGVLYSRDKYTSSSIEGDVTTVSVFVGSGACILPDGTMLADRVSYDSASYESCVSTQSLITKTGVAAADMAKLYGLNLTEREIKMAYLLDQTYNGSLPPDDVEGERVGTILDTLVDV